MTELQRLNKIYKYCYPIYKKDFKNIVVVDKVKISKELKMTEFEFFNYVYYDLNKRCHNMFNDSSKQNVKTWVGDTENNDVKKIWIHMGNLEAMRKDEIKTNKRFKWPMLVSIIALIVSIIALF